jgi:predicted nucleic acid-binding protein
VTAAPELVVDSSVAFKWLAPHPEEGADAAWELLGAHARGELVLIAPALLPFEVTNALRYSGLGQGSLLRAVRALSEVDLSLVVPDGDLLEAASRIALVHDLTVYDASFAALAAERGCELVTADRQAFAGCDACRVRLV